MKTVEYRWGDRIFHLCMNGAALFDCYDQFGTENNLLDHIVKRGRKGFENTVWMACKLSEQGELVRRYMGHPAGEVLSYDECAALLKPADVVRMKQAVRKAVTLGFSREEEAIGPVDLGLAELEQKKRRNQQEPIHPHPDADV